MHPLIFRIIEANRALGSKRMVWTIPQWIVRKEYLVNVKDLRRPLPDLPAREFTRWTALTEAEIDLVHAINPTMSEAEIRRRLKQGQECLLCWINGSLAYYRWDAACPVYLPYLNKTFRPLEGDYIGLDKFTDPAFRGCGLDSASSLWSMHRKRDLGFTRGIGIIASWNTPALRVRRKLPGTVVGRVGYWNTGPWRFYFATGGVCLDKNSMYIREHHRCGH